MRKIIILIISLTLLVSGSHAQKTISGKSGLIKNFNIKPKYKRGLPPNLYVNLSFEDDNSNGILEPDENAILRLSITNEGKGPAQGLLVNVKQDLPVLEGSRWLNTYDAPLTIDDGRKVPYIYPGQTVDLDINIGASFGIKTAEHKLEITITEYYGYDMDPAYLILNTMEYLEPKLVFSGLEVVDVGTGTGAIIEDGQIQAGEQVQVKLVVQNIGQNISKNTEYKIVSNNNNIYVTGNKGVLGDISVGEVKEFWITVSPNKRVDVTKPLPVYLSLSNMYGIGEIKSKALPLALNQKPAQTEIVKVEADIESLTQQVARFEYSSNKITANLDNIIDIRLISPSKTIRDNSVAIIMGIEKYKNFTSAPYAANDAKIMEDYFKNILGVEKVFLFTNSEVSGFFFDDKFNPDYGDLQKAILKGKTELFVFYSGHGMPSKDGSKVYLFPSDGRLEAVSRQGYDLNTFYQNLASLNAKSTTIFIDACFSGVSRASESRNMKNLVSMKGVAIKPRVNQPWETDANFTVFSSSSFEETSLGFDPSETGLFTYYLCAGLQGNADTNGDKKITSGELKEYVIKNVSETSVKILGKQTPIFNGNESIILGEY